MSALSSPGSDEHSDKHARHEVSTETPAPQREASTDTAHFSLAESFWDTPRLKLVRQEAWARELRPEALLAVLLARMTASLDPRVVLDDTGKGYGPINLFVVLVGPSGAGKSTTMHIAETMLHAPRPAPVLHPSTGEGLHTHFRERRKVRSDDPLEDDGDAGGVSTTGATVQETWVNRNAIAVVDEISTLLEKAKSHTQSLMSDLRAMWVGATVGTTTKTAQSRVSVPAMGYRLSMIVGAQVHLASDLTGSLQRGDGTYQRLMFVPTWVNADEYVDGWAPHPASYWEDPRHTLWPRITQLEDLEAKPLDPAVDRVPASEYVVVTIEPAVREALRAARRQGQSYDSTGDTGHNAYHQLRWAAALALFDQRMEVTKGDWAKAGEVMELRERVVDDIDEVAARAQEERSQLDGIMLSQRDNARMGSAALTETVRRRVIEIVEQHDRAGVHPGMGCSKRCFRSLSRAQLAVLPTALADAVKANELVVDGIVNGRGARYSRAG